jgi:uncharacterized protein YdcH (DUF465 family)
MAMTRGARRIERHQESPMSHTPHELHNVFPEAADAIHRLKASNHHFARLAEEYHVLTRQIHRAEIGAEPMEDLALETLKKQRLAHADAIAAILKADAEAQSHGACGKANPSAAA